MSDGVGKWRRILVPIALVAGGIAVALAMGEVVARVAWLGAKPAASWTPDTPGDLRELTSIFELAAPNARGMFRGRPYRSNSAGFRGPEYAATTPPGTFRIAIAGDSFTMGEKVFEEEAYPAVLEKKLNAVGDGRRYEVLNLGLSGLSIKWVMQRLEIGLNRFHPDLIVYGFTINDIEGPAYRESVPLEARVARQREYLATLESPSYLMRAIRPRLESLRDTLFVGPGSYAYDLQENYFHNPQAWADFAAGLDRLATDAREEGVCAHVLIHTQVYELNFLHPFRNIYAKVADAAKARGLTVTQSFPLFRGYDERAVTISADDTHPNALGHELLARALFEGLHALPRNCWAGRGRGVESPAHVDASGG
jgi:lysophospholipase L1-like esterase